MLSFAPFLYRNIFVDNGGPIERIACSPFPNADGPRYQAIAYLKPGLNDGANKAYALFGNGDGTGSASSPEVAKHKAISEALERWAIQAVRRSPSERGKYGLDYDSSSNGMAAFPGFKWQARRSAYFEALERWALFGWWEDHLEGIIQQAPYPNTGLIRISHGQKNGEVVILFRKSADGDMAYAHASGKTLASACHHAAFELACSEKVLTQYRNHGARGPITHYFERRLLYFASAEGQVEFFHRVNTSATKAPLTWRTIFDGEIVGPWSQWATVWRHCVEMPNRDFLAQEKNYFFW